MVLRDCVNGDMRATLRDGLDDGVAECTDRELGAENLQTARAAAGRLTDERAFTAARDSDLDDMVIDRVGGGCGFAIGT